MVRSSSVTFLLLLMAVGGCSAKQTGQPAPKATPQELAQREKFYQAELKHLAQTPATPQVQDEYWRGEVTGKQISLSFDDGPRPEWTEKLLKVLKANDVKATFYLVGKMVELNPKQAKAIAADGHEIGNHSFTHPNLAKSEALDVEKEILATQNVIRQVTGVTPVTMRPPGGNISPAVREANKKAGLAAMMWDNNPGDYDLKDPAKVKERLMARLKPGNLILLHNGIQATVDMLDDFIKEAKRQGYTFVTHKEYLKK